MAQLSFIPMTQSRKKTADGNAPRRFISTLKTRRRGVYVAIAFVLSLLVVAWKSRVTPRELAVTAAESVLRSLESNKSAAPDLSVTHANSGKCFKHVLYDKPVKTGSTAVSFSIREYLRSIGEYDHPCGHKGPLTCVERAEAICNGTVSNEDFYSVIGHLKKGGRELVDCLRPSHYIVTSVRDPYQRRKSSYLWNRTMNGTHFAIPHTASFKEFMERLPRCQLYDYYDGKGDHCDPETTEQRIKDIVERVDEVIDLYDSTPVGPLHKRIAGYVGRENESVKLDEKTYIEEFDRETLKEEQMLYDRLQEKRMQPPNPDRIVC